MGKGALSVAVKFTDPFALHMYSRCLAYRPPFTINSHPSFILSFPIMWAMILRKKKRKDFYSLWEKMNLKRSQYGIPNKGKEQKARKGVLQTIV